jgi:hypothetical protein
VSTATSTTRPRFVDPLAVLSERIEAVLQRLAISSVFAPDSALSLGQREALDEIEGLADELVGAVFSVLPKGVPVPSTPVRVERDWFAAVEQWSSAWKSAPDSLVLDALMRSLFEDRATFAQVLPRGDRDRIDRDLAAAHAMIVERSDAMRGRWITGVAPSVVAAARHIEWLSGGREERSPGSVALALFERGVWPMLLPDGAVLLWIAHESLRSNVSVEWTERYAERVDALRERDLPWGLSLARCSALGLGALTLSERRAAVALEVRRPDLPIERIELGPIARVGRGAGSDLSVKNGLISRSHFTVYFVNEWVLLDVDRAATNGARIGDERITQRAFSSDGAEPWVVGDIEFRLVRDEAKSNGLRALVHTGPCGYSKTFSDRAKRAGSEDSGLRFHGQALARGIAKHPRAAAIVAQVERWSSGPRFAPLPGLNDDEHAQRWVDEHARALFSAVHAVAPIVATAPAKVHLERSLVRACNRVQRAWTTATEGRANPLRMRMAFALDQLPHEDGRGAKSVSGAATDTQVRASNVGLDRTQSGAVLLYASALQRATTGWTRDVLPFAQRFAWIDPDCVGALARKVIRWEAGGYESSGANPWAMMFEWWLRGALFWHLPDDEALVFVPFRDQSGALEVNPGAEVPPALSQGNFVTTALWGVGDVIVPLFRKAMNTAERGERVGRGRGRSPDAQLVYREGWLWARDVRWDLQGTTVLGTDGKLVDDDLASTRRSFRIVAEDGVHWAMAPEIAATRETLRVNGRSVRGRPLLHGDLVELERDGATLFSGRYECAEQNTAAPSRRPPAG